ncbi:MAG: CPBP family intramembrane metalloprotease [Prevotella sp.]|nr:CPBP family intramembrane metalloprotease [Prevotella sp.]
MKPTDFRLVCLTLGVAAVMFFVMFSPWTSPHVNFWYTMTATALVLTSLSLYFCRETLGELRFSWRSVVGGLLLAFLLWCVFWLGDKISSWMFGFARPQVDMIYGMKSGTSPTVIALLLLFVIGPGEELFWRAFLQRRLMEKWGANAGFVAATACYTLVHVWSFNFMLIMAALVAGVCWGFLYRLSPRLLPALVVSHAVWDACAFVFFPI